MTSGVDIILQAAHLLDGPYAARAFDRHNLHGYAKAPNVADGDGDRDTDSNSGTDSPRERRRNGGREVHNALEKNRRQQLKDCFNILRGVVPSLQQKKHSNQAILKGSQKYIQSITLKERKYQQELQDLARQRAVLTERLKKLSDEFEQKHNFSARHYLQHMYGNADEGASENESDATESATEGPDNAHDFDDEVEEVPDAPPAASQSSAGGDRLSAIPASASQSTARGIPHSVIRETPLVSQRQHQSSDSIDGPQHATMASSQAAASKPTLQATDVKQQLLAKLATKQAHPVQAGSTVINNPHNMVSLPDGKLQIIDMMGAGRARVPIPSQPRQVVQSLLSSSLTRPQIGRVINALTTAGSTLVTSAVPTSSAILSAVPPIHQINLQAPVQRPNGAQQMLARPYGAFPQGLYSTPTIIVSASSTGQLMIPVAQPSLLPQVQPNLLPQVPPSLFVMSNYTQNPIIAQNPVATQNPVMTQNPVITQNTVVTQNPVVTQNTVVTQNPVVPKSTS